VSLGLCLLGVIVKLAISGASSTSVNAATQVLKAPSAEPAPMPPASDPAATASASSESSPEPAPADDFSDDLKQRGLGYLTVHSSIPRANVYVNLKARGKVEEKLTVPCGNRFVSIGLPPASHGAEPLWLAPGKMMLVPCGGPLETTMEPRALRTR